MHLTSTFFSRFNVTRPDLLALLGVAIFAGTYPATRMAVIGGIDPLLNATCRIMGAGALAALVLRIAHLTGSTVTKPSRAELIPLLAVGVGVGLIFPLGLGYALRSVPASHGAVVMAALPLVTTLYSCLRGHAWPSRRFWFAGCGASLLVIAFSWRHAPATGHPGDTGFSDLLLILAMFGAAVGYVEGARLTTPQRPGWQVISWALVLLFPVVSPCAIWFLMTAGPITPVAWVALGYGTLFSMYLGFFPWYRAMQLAGVARISQWQYLQPFTAITYAVVLLNEHIDGIDLALVLGVILAIAWGRRPASS